MKALLFFALFFFFSIAYAQDEKVGDDAANVGPGNIQNAFKIDVLPSICGDVTFIYERFLFDRWSLEAGGGFLLGYGLNNFRHFLNQSSIIHKRTGGYKIVFNGLYHSNGGRLDGTVYGLTGFYRSINNKSMYESVGYDISETYVGYYYGRRNGLGATTSLEFGVSIGLLFVGSASDVSQDVPMGNAMVNFTFSLKLALHK